MEIKETLKNWIRNLVYGVRKWIMTIVIALISGAIGYVVEGTSGFVAMALASVIISFLLLLCMVPFVGIFLYWNLGNMFADYLFKALHLHNLGIAKLFPLIVYGVLGAIVYIIFTVLGLFLLGVLISALCSKR